MILVMAVQQRGPWIIGDEVNPYRAEPRHVDCVLHQARSLLVAHFGDLERVPMQMDGMVVAAFVGHDKTVALSLLRREQGIRGRP